MNETLHTWLKHFGDSTIAASYWMGIDENEFLELLGYEHIDPKLEETLQGRMRIMPKKDDEIEALKSVIMDQDRKLSYAAQAANDFLESINQNQYKGYTE
ncbi:MAG: hypothetical protein P794_09485 [Epsilonproteobacteria bacterium (ex Lamellibrachia satsuma)]|nr:MAG: hypothetical protein P794_09485 [Epsilonproteobacteria bacterium (ex Lamellibrachia satsuma)]